MEKLKFPITLEVLYQIFIIVMLVLGLEFLLMKWVPLNVLKVVSGIILVVAAFLLAWYNSKKIKSRKGN